MGQRAVGESHRWIERERGGGLFHHFVSCCDDHNFAGNKNVLITSSVNITEDSLIKLTETCGISVSIR